MSHPFFDHPLLSPYAYPERHWELDETGPPAQRILAARQPAPLMTQYRVPATVRSMASARDSRTSACAAGTLQCCASMPAGEVTSTPK